MENYLNARKDSVIQYRVNLLLDVEFEDEYYNASNKLSSFFGQIGVYENTEKLLNLINNYYKDLNFSFLIFKEKSDFEKDEELLDGEESLKMFFKSDDDSYEQDNNIEEIFNENSNIYEEFVLENKKLNLIEEINENNENSENNYEEGEIDEEDENYFFFFIPLIMTFYRGDRKMDYFLGNEFKEKFFFKEKIVLFKEKLYAKKFLKKIFFFKKNYKKNQFFKKFNKNK